MPFEGAEARTSKLGDQLLTPTSQAGDDCAFSRLRGTTLHSIEGVGGKWTTLDTNAPRSYLWATGGPSDSRHERFACIYNIIGRRRDHLAH